MVADSIDTAADEQPDDRSADEEPDTRGTVFLTLVFLMMTFGMWTVMYIMLLNR